MEKQLYILYLRKASFKRVWNAWLVLMSFYWSRLINKPVQWGLPISISVEPTTACNLKCPQCPSGLRSFSRPTGHLRIEDYQKWIEPIKNKIWSINFYFQGEPFVHPEINKAIRYANDRGIFTISSTNGHFLNQKQCIKIIESGLDQLTVSVDGTNQEVYEKYRIGGSFEKVMDGIKTLIHTKQELNSKKPFVILQLVIMKHNVHQLEELKSISTLLKVDALRLKTAQIYDYERGSEFIPEQEVYSRYKSGADRSYEIKNKLLNHCWRLWHAPVLTWDGKMVPCCFDKDADYPLGSLKQSSLKEIWQNSHYNDFRGSVIKSRKSISICQNCTEGTKVWI